jgi:hypothetical protein
MMSGDIFCATPSTICKPGQNRNGRGKNMVRDTVQDDNEWLAFTDLSFVLPP